MIELLRTRRSVRKYKDRKIEIEKIKILKEAALRSPTSRNRQPWEFIFVDDMNLISKLSKAKEHGSQFLTNAPLAIVVCGDETISDVWIEDCSIASINLQMTCESLKLGSCWIQIRNRNHSDSLSSEKYIQNLLNIPDNLKILSIISIGYSDEKKQLIDFSQLNHKKIRLNDNK